MTLFACKRTSLLWLLPVLVLLPVLLPDTAGARPAPGAGAGARNFYIEFRTRMGSPSGHSYLVAGRIDRVSRTRQLHHYGFYVPSSSPEYVMALVGARGTFGKSELDRKHSVTNRYRLRVSRQKYEKAMRFIARLKRQKHDFALFSTNCNYFVGQVARHIGMRAPDDTIQFPKQYLDQMKRLNGHRAAL